VLFVDLASADYPEETKVWIDAQVRANDRSQLRLLVVVSASELGIFRSDVPKARFAAEGQRRRVTQRNGLERRHALRRRNARPVHGPAAGDQTTTQFRPPPGGQ